MRSIHSYDCDAFRSVQFSNHTKYSTVKVGLQPHPIASNMIDHNYLQPCLIYIYVNGQGEVLSGDNLRDLADGLAANELLAYDYVLTGYIGDSHSIVCSCISDASYRLRIFSV